MFCVHKKQSIFALVLIFALAFAGCKNLTGDTSSAGNTGGNSTGTSTTDNSDVVPNVDDEVRSCFNLVNQFRTGNEAYYWNEDNKTKTNLVGKLGRLTLDEDLCRAAQIRANEIVTNFSHTRPDGTSCKTVLTELSIPWNNRGENIAAGYSSGLQTFDQWKEDSENFDGQGHRRNMLGDFTKIGIAHAYSANSQYRYYWAMILTK